MTSPAESLPGEHLDVLERVVLAEAGGVFTPMPPETFTTEGEIVHAGQMIGTIAGAGTSTDVRCGFSGFLMGMLASGGERVRAGQPVAWLRAFGTP